VIRALENNEEMGLYGECSEEEEYGYSDESE